MLRFLTLMAVIFCARAEVPALMPLPAKIESAAGSLVIDGNFTAAATGVSDARLDAALSRLLGRISRQTGIPFASKPATSPNPAQATLRVQCSAPGPAYPALGEDESYDLTISPDGATLKAGTVDGGMHGLETFLQLIAPSPDGFRVPALHIQDSPRFPWRGLMIDASRHWMPVPVIERNLDAMAAVKLNVFHWHLSDDQGFRVESKKYPRLQQMGSDGDFYTQAEIRQVIAYARDRGIRVIPEFDVPAHTASWMPGYPELASGPGPYQLERNFGIHDEVMDPSSDWTYTFLDNFFGEMAQLFPDAYFHIGGDENNGKLWNQSPRIQAFAKLHKLANARDLQVYFNQRVQKILQKHGKTMIGWDEVLHPDLPTATVVQTWRGQAALAESASKGYRGILSWGYYLDHLRPTSYHYAIDPLGGPAAQLTPEQTALILGGETCMWTELVNAETIDSRIWPRTAAIAERFWSPKEVTDVDSMYTRMEAVSRLLEWTGVQHRSGYGPMLDRLAGGRSADALRVLADASEAKGLGTGRSARGITTQTPFNRFVDAVRPESESVRALEQVATRVVAGGTGNQADVEGLREQFSRWASNDARFQVLAGNNGLLAELKPLSRDLSALGAAGLRLLDQLTGGPAVPPDWVAMETAEITRLAMPNADVVLAAARPVKVLLDAVKSK